MTAAKKLPLVLLLCTLLACSTSALAELLVTTADGRTTTYSFTDLDRMVGLIEREIPDDYLYKRAKRYRGYDLNRLFEVLELPRDQTYLLVCTDGYEIEFDASLLKDSRFEGLLARGDVESDEWPWLPFKVGANSASLSPFYLAWAAADPAAQEEARQTLPWPYAMNEIRVHDAGQLHAAARPSAGSGTEVHDGFETFTANCMKCHKVNKAGGSLGPELTTSPSVAFTTDAELADVIVNIKRYYPDSKMPTYHEVLTPAEVKATVSYLRHINRQATNAQVDDGQPVD